MGRHRIVGDAWMLPEASHGGTPERALTEPMDTKTASDVANAELELNNALVSAEISNGYEEYLAILNRFYDDNVEVVSSARDAPLIGKAQVQAAILRLLLPLHVMAEIGGLSVRLQSKRLFSDSLEEQHAEWSLQLLGAAGRGIVLTWSSARRWKDGRVTYERHSELRQSGEALTILDLHFATNGMAKN